MSSWKKCFETAELLDRELEGSLDRNAEVFKKFGKCSDYFKDLYETNKRFRESIKRISDVQNSSDSRKEHTKNEFNKDQGDITSDTSSYESDEELPFEDKAKAYVMRLGKDNDINSRKWEEGNNSLFNSEGEKNDWLTKVLRQRQEEIKNVIDQLESKESEDEDEKILEELEKQWKKINLEEMTKEERTEADSLKKRIDEGLMKDSKNVKSRRTYVQSNEYEHSFLAKKKSENLNKKKERHCKTKKELYDSFVNKV